MIVIGLAVLERGPFMPRWAWHTVEDPDLQKVDVVELVCAQADADWIELSITDDPRLAARYADEIPVVLVDGRVHDIYRVNPDRLRAALAG